MPGDRFRVRNHTTPCQHIRGYYRSTAKSQEEKLHLAVKQYIPKSNSQPSDGDVTFIAAHCAGMFKELYEPLFNELIRLSELPDSAFRIRAIWLADVASHGQSSELNEGKLGYDLSWDDHARDLLHMTNHFRDEMIRPIVGLGHSAGGTMILRLAAMHPRLFVSLMTFEPAVNETFSPQMNYAPSYYHSVRRDVWPSLEQAFEETKRIGAQRYWDAEVLKRWHDYGFRPGPTLEHPEDTDAVTLSTPKHHAARAFSRAIHPEPKNPLLSVEIDRRTHPDITKENIARLKQPAYTPTAIAVWRDLPHLLPSTLFIYGDKPSIAAARPEARAHMLPHVGSGLGGSGGLDAGKVRDVTVAGVGHFGPFEKPQAVAGVCDAWLQEQYSEWMREERLNKEEWNARGDCRDKATLDNEWMWWASETYGKKVKPAPKPASRL